MEQENFSIDYMSNTKQLIYFNINDIYDQMQLLYNSVNDLFSFLKQIDSEDKRVLVNNAGQLLLKLNRRKSYLKDDIDEFLVTLDSYIGNERDIDGYCNHVLTGIQDEMYLLEQDLQKI